LKVCNVVPPKQAFVVSM